MIVGSLNGGTYLRSREVQTPASMPLLRSTAALSPLGTRKHSPLAEWTLPRTGAEVNLGAPPLGPNRARGPRRRPTQAKGSRLPRRFLARHFAGAIGVRREVPPTRQRTPHRRLQRHHLERAQGQLRSPEGQPPRKTAARETGLCWPRAAKTGPRVVFFLFWVAASSRYVVQRDWSRARGWRCASEDPCSSRSLVPPRAWLFAARRAGVAALGAGNRGAGLVGAFGWRNVTSTGRALSRKPPCLARSLRRQEMASLHRAIGQLFLGPASRARHLSRQAYGPSMTSAALGKRVCPRRVLLPENSKAEKQPHLHALSVSPKLPAGANSKSPSGPVSRCRASLSASSPHCMTAGTGGGRPNR